MCLCVFPCLLSEPKAVVLTFEQASESHGWLTKTQILGLHPRVSDSAGMGEGQRICASNNFPTDAKTAVLKI